MVQRSVPVCGSEPIIASMTPKHAIVTPLSGALPDSTDDRGQTEHGERQHFRRAERQHQRPQDRDRDRHQQRAEQAAEHRGQ